MGSARTAQRRADYPLAGAAGRVRGRRPAGRPWSLPGPPAAALWRRTWPGCARRRDQPGRVRRGCGSTRVAASCAAGVCPPGPTCSAGRRARQCRPDPPRLWLSRATRTLPRWLRSAQLHDRTRALRRSVHLRHVDAGSDGSEEWEIMALLNPVYDIHRLGMFLTASPRHADILLVTGSGARGMAGPLRETYEAMPHPEGSHRGRHGCGRRRHRQPVVRDDRRHRRHRAGRRLAARLAAEPVQPSCPPCCWRWPAAAAGG